jgi:hypothetical protein
MKNKKFFRVMFLDYLRSDNGKAILAPINQLFKVG